MGRRGPWEDGREAWQRLAGWSVSGCDGAASLEALDDISQLRRALDQTELEAVRAARREGKSWAEIAMRLGITRQSAWERWRELDESPSGHGPPISMPQDTPEVRAIADAVVERAARDLRRRSTVKVPDVVGLSHVEAQAVLLGSGLIAIGPDPEAAPALGGTVTDQSPEAGAKVPHGSVVTLWVDRGGGSGVREPRRPGPDPKHAHEWAPEPEPDERAVS